MRELTNQLSQPVEREELAEEISANRRAREDGEKGGKRNKKEDKYGLMDNIVIESLPPMREEGPRVFIISWKRWNKKKDAGLWFLSGLCSSDSLTDINNVMDCFKGQILYCLAFNFTSEGKAFRRTYEPIVKILDRSLRETLTPFRRNQLKRLKQIR